MKDTKGKIQGVNGILYEILTKEDTPFRYRLLHDYKVPTPIKLRKTIELEFVALKTTGTLHIKKGFLWDGATCFPDFDWIIRASLVHDALYKLIFCGLLPPSLRLVADTMLKALLTQDMLKLKAGRIALMAISGIVYAGVRIFGESRARGSLQKDQTVYRGE